MKVCVVGAGASGLPAVRVCLEYGYEVVCFEKSADIGGIWRYKQQVIDGEGCVMKSTVINSSKEMTAYSDYPPPSNFANFMHNTQLLRYFKMYAEHHNLLKYIKLNHCVTNISRMEDFIKTGQWTVNYLDEYYMDMKRLINLMEFCWLLATTFIPTCPSHGQAKRSSKGPFCIATHIRTHRGYEDKRIVIVGIGNSGGDIAVELSCIASQIYLVTRRGTWVINRLSDYGDPADLALSSRFLDSMRLFFPTSFHNWFFERQLEKRFDHAKYGLKPAHRVLSAHPTVNDELPNRIACGTVTIKPNIAYFSEAGIMFEDGSVVNNIDTVILATGYKFSIPYVEGGQLIPVQDNKVNLYLYMYPPNLAGKNSLAVLGLVQPLGPLMPISEMQACVFCDVLSGNSKLPDKQGMLENINAKRRELADRYIQTPRHTIQVDYTPYTDELAELIGAKPDIWMVLKSDPLFGMKLLFGPNVPYQYRINGPHPWSGAREAIMHVQERVDAATRSHKTAEIVSSPSYIWVYIFIGVLITWFYLCT